MSGDCAHPLESLGDVTTRSLATRLLKFVVEHLFLFFNISCSTGLVKLISSEGTSSM